MNDTQRNKSQPKRHPRQAATTTDASPAKAEKPGLQCRQAAAKILAAVIDRKTPLDGMLDNDSGNPAYRALSDADRALVRAILNTALRHLPRIETILGSLVQTPLPEGALRATPAMLPAAAGRPGGLDGFYAVVLRRI